MPIPRGGKKDVVRPALAGIPRLRVSGHDTPTLYQLVQGFLMHLATSWRPRRVDDPWVSGPRAYFGALGGSEVDSSRNSVVMDLIFIIFKWGK